jgi:transposase
LRKEKPNDLESTKQLLDRVRHVATDLANQRPVINELLAHKMSADIPERRAKAEELDRIQTADAENCQALMEELQKKIDEMSALNTLIQNVEIEIARLQKNAEGISLATSDPHTDSKRLRSAKNDLPSEEALQQVDEKKQDANKTF